MPTAVASTALNSRKVSKPKRAAIALALLATSVASGITAGVVTTNGYSGADRPSTGVHSIIEGDEVAWYHPWFFTRKCIGCKKYFGPTKGPLA